MPYIIEYPIKLSGTLMILYLFYRLLLSRLTFYTANRWYLLVYSIVAFFIPLIDISPMLEKAQLHTYEVVQWVPVIEANGSKAPEPTSGFASPWNASHLFALVFCTGALFMLIRFIIQYCSVGSMRRHSRLVSDGNIKVYQVDKDIIPFSFGNAIFINPNNHTEVELKEIIKHEFVHVKQKHTIDILWSECLCILNWYNPFAWLIRNSIRQNLEFIADNKVIQSGINRKQYQYLLLKVIGVPHYSIATNFNFASLKKRIAMMNKMQSAKLHFIKFLLVFPLLAVILLAFRNRLNPNVTDRDGFTATSALTGALEPVNIVDTVPGPPAALQPLTLNGKGYLITVADNHGECIVIVKNKQNKIVKAVSLVEWDENKKEYTDQYGEIPPAPASSPRVIIDRVPKDQSAGQQSKPDPFIYKIPSPNAAPSTILEPETMPENVSAVHVKNKIFTITFKNGETEIYDLNKRKDKEAFEEKYGRASGSPLNKQNPDAKPNPENSPTAENKKSSEPNSQNIKPPTVIIGPKPAVDRNKGVTINSLGDFDGLIIIDGKDYDKKSFESEVNLRGEDIQSIDILKGESAKQLYGEKGKNGVINITTKRK